MGLLHRVDQEVEEETALLAQCNTACLCVPTGSLLCSVAIRLIAHSGACWVCGSHASSVDQGEETQVWPGPCQVPHGATGLVSR